MADDDTTPIDPAPDPDDESELIRSALGEDYEIVEELGRGGMAVVYRARERSLDREVAIKVLPLARTFDTELVARFQREARTSASLEHPHIVPIYRVGQSGRVSFFAMKYVRGPSLSELLVREGRLEPAEVERLLRDVSDALDHAHAHGVVHRDVKPDNIMKDQTDRYVVMDFGIARSVSGTRLTQGGASIGTPRYTSPEQAKGAEVDGRSDLYSLGVVAYHSLVGRAPFEGDDPLAILYAHLHEPAPEPTLDSDDARRVFAVIGRLLAKDPAKRLQSGTDVRAALSRPSEVAAITAQRPTRGGAAPALERATQAALGVLRTRGRSLGVAAVLTVALVALLGRDGAAARCREAMPNPSDGDSAVLLDPPGSQLPGTEIELSYVVCGLADDEPFTTRATIRSADGGGLVGRVGRFFGGGSDPFRETWDDEANGFATARERRIDPGDLEPGSYRILLETEGSDGRDAEASHEFTIVDR